MTERRVDLALAAALAVLPLLPTGLEHAGLPPRSWPEIILLVLAGVRLVTPDRRPLDDRRTLPRGFAPALTIYAVAISGAALVGLAAENALGSRVFSANLASFPGRVLGGFDQLADPLYPLRVWLTLIEGPLAFLLTFDICRRATEPARRTRVAAGGAVIGLALVSAFAIVQYVTRFNLHPYWVAANPELTRSHATFEDPNALGSYLLLGISLAAALALRGWKSRRSGTVWALAATVTLALLALMTTVSRAAWAAAIVAAVVSVAYGPTSTPGDRLPLYRRLARAATVVGLLLVLAWSTARAVVPSQSAPRPSTPLQAMVVSLDPRVPLAQVLKKRDVYWKAALRMFAEHPLTGVGLGRYPRLAAGFGASGVAPENAHNFPLQVLAEAGAAGLIACALLAAAVVGVLRPTSADPPPGETDTTWVLRFGLLALGLTLLSGHALLLPSIQLVLGTWLAVGMSYAGLRRRVESSRGLARSTALAAVILLAVYVPVARAERWQGSRDPWGYTWGLHAGEHDAAGTPFRWTAAEARLHVVPPPGSTAVVLACSVLSDVDGGVRSTSFEAVGHHVTASCENGRWQEVALPLASAVAMDIRITVAGAFSPAARGLSGDRRVLGATLRPPRFVGASGSDAPQRGAGQQPAGNR